MPTLSDVHIFDLIASGKLKISPLIEDNIQPASIDLTLGKIIQVFKWDSSKGQVDVTKKDINYDSYMENVDISNGYDLQPGEIVTGHSAEEIVMPSNLNGIIVNRNSLTLLGLNAAISQYINPGFHGNKIIVIKNESCNVIKITAGIRICQLVLFKLILEPRRTYDTRHSTELLGQPVRNNYKSEHIDSSIAAYMDKLIEKIALGKSQI